LATFILADKDIKNNVDKVFFLRFYRCVLLSCPMISSIHCHLIWGMCVEITFWSLANFEHFLRFEMAYRISSYKALPWIIPATLIIPAILISLCRRNVVFSNKTRIWRLHRIIIAAGLIWGNMVFYLSQLYSFDMKSIEK
jgi:hypothetical protein